MQFKLVIMPIIITTHTFSHSLQKFGALDLLLFGLMVALTVTIQVKTFRETIWCRKLGVSCFSNSIAYINILNCLRILTKLKIYTVLET